MQSCSISPTSVPPTQYLTIVLLVPVLSSTVTTCGPERPWKALYIGPASSKSVPSKKV